MTKFILTAPTGNLGSRVLSSILKYNLIPASSLILCTSSPVPDPSSTATPPRIPLAAQHDIPTRYSASFAQQPSQLVPSFADADVLFLSSYPSPSVQRWEYHRNAIDAAILAGITTIVYTSLMFGGESGRDSVAGVMTAHLKTIDYLEGVRDRIVGEGGKFDFVVVREGIYAESWWLYCGYQPKLLTKEGVGEEGGVEFVVPNDGKLAWVGWDDLGEGTARILADYKAYLGKSFRLTGPRASSLGDIAEMMADVTGWKVGVKAVGKKEAERYHKERQSADEGNDWAVESWVGWFDGLREGECEVVDPLLGELLGRTPRGIEEMKEDLFRVHERK